MTTGGPQHVLIIGGGIAGAILAQALRKKSIPFSIFERDAHPAARGQGWGITLQWALPALYSALPDDLRPRLIEAQVDPSIEPGRQMDMVCLNAATAELRYRIPPAERIRVKRERLRRLMLEGLPVQWNKRLVGLTTDSAGVTAEFEDGTSATGTLLVGADGSGSRARKILAPETHALVPLPVRCISLTISVTPEQMAPLAAIAPLLFQATHPVTNDFLWWSVLDTPETSGDGNYAVQIALSWDKCNRDQEPPAENSARVAMVKQLVDSFASPLKDIIQRIPDDTFTATTNLGDWANMCWDNRGGRATLAGDAAHAMTMYRGDAANHGITDAANLADCLQRVANGEVGLELAITQYEEELRRRCRPAVRASRQACLDAHHWDRIGAGSPLVEREPGAELRLGFGLETEG